MRASFGPSLLALVLLAACGQKGPLVLPHRAPVAVPASAAATPAPAAAAAQPVEATAPSAPTPNTPESTAPAGTPPEAAPVTPPTQPTPPKDKADQPDDATGAPPKD